MPTCPAGHTSGADDYCDVCGTRMTGPPVGSGPVTSAPSTGGGSGTGPGPSAPTATGPAGAVCPDCSAPRTGRFCEGCGYDFAVGAGRPDTTRPTQGFPASAPPPAGPPPGAPPPTSPPAAAPPPAGPPAGAPAAPADFGQEFADGQATGKWVSRSTPSTPSPESSPAASVPAPSAVTWTAVVGADRDYYETVVRQSGEAGFTFPPYCPERQIPLDRPQVRIGRRSVSQGTVPEIDLGEPPEDPGASHTHAVLLSKPDGTWTLVDPGSTNGTTVNGGEDPIPVNVEVPMNDGDRIHIGVWTTITLRRG